MFQQRKSSVILVLLLLFISNTSVFGRSFDLAPGVKVNANGYIKPESFFGNNITFLNKNNDVDKVWYPRHIIDCTIDMLFGEDMYDHAVAEVLFSVRNKSNWGASGTTMITTPAEIKELDVVYGTHVHATPLIMWWMRELWLHVNLVPAFGLPFESHHSVTIGSFPFILGRGIALGDAFATGAGFLGFFTDDAIDQYAYGVKFSGDIFESVLGYDWYTAILQNKALSLAFNSEKIYAQAYGRRSNPARGFGSVNFLTTARLRWWPYDNLKGTSLYLEPYVLFNHDPEQRIEFVGDASAKLGTVGMAGEAKWGSFEGGFDCAFNLGQQSVNGWDRNKIIEQNNGGQVIIANNNVFAVVGTNPDGSDILVNVPYVSANDPAQKIIFNSYQDESQNGKIIGEVDQIGFLKRSDDQPIPLKNGSGRFVNPYRNKFDGWMFVIDGGYWIRPKELFIAAEFGIASGDDNPNFETHDEEYDGFISLQEVYSGNRVKSAFVLGGAGRARRPFSIPRDDFQGRLRNAAVSKFTNLIYAGTGLVWKSDQCLKPFRFNPNILAYWQERPLGRILDTDGIIRDARSFLGIEANLFSSCRLLPDLEALCVASIFFPGSHYVDRSGLDVLSKEELDILDQVDVTGFQSDRVPGLGSNIAYTLNLGLKYSF